MVECLFALAYHLADHVGGQLGELLEVVRELEGVLGGGQVQIRLAEVCLRGGCQRRAEKVLKRGDRLVGEMLGEEAE